MDEEPGGVLAIDELANWLREFGSMLYKPALEGRVPCQEIGRNWRFRRRAIVHCPERDGIEGVKPK